MVPASFALDLIYASLITFARVCTHSHTALSHSHSLSKSLSLSLFAVTQIAQAVVATNQTEQLDERCPDAAGQGWQKLTRVAVVQKNNLIK